MKTIFVIPTYNEAENIKHLIPEVLKQTPDLLVVVVDDNSPDGTGRIADELAAEYPGRIEVIHRIGERGFGTAYITGYKKALALGADNIGQMDCDFSHPPEKINELITRMAKGGCDAVIGSRYVEGGGVDKDWPFWRKALSRWGGIYSRMILGFRVKDPTAGYRLYSRTMFNEFPLDRVRSNGYVFQIEMTYIAHKLGYRIAEIPIYFPDRKWGQSKMNFRIQVEAALRVWWLLFEYRDLHKHH